ncbi:MAG: hypothetical protein PHV37_03820 [Candidatus Gastranaerophilales bacterium]|nr:hypothetical protein [Candidatus Gastranaerophilales bacterium]
MQSQFYITIKSPISGNNKKINKKLIIADFYRGFATWRKLYRKEASVTCGMKCKKFERVNNPRGGFLPWLCLMAKTLPKRSKCSLRKEVQKV